MDYPIDVNDWSINDWVDHWRYGVGANVIPANTRSKTTFVNWKEYQNSPISEEQHERWKAEGSFNDGIAIIAGKTWHAKNPNKNGLYLILVDLDNKKAIQEFCTRNGTMTSLAELAKTLIIEQHDDDPDKAHVIFYASHPFPKKSSDILNQTLSEKLDKNEIPAIEIKGAGEHGILFVTPSTHKKGHKYRIIGIKELNTQIDAFETHLDNICNKYGISYLTNGNNGNNTAKQPINELFNEDTKIYEGHNRHEAMLRVDESLLRRNQKILTYEQIKPLALAWNQKHCIPPLDNREFERQWKDAIAFIQRANSQKEKGTASAKYPELVGNIYYQINEKPDRYIVAYTQTHKVIEITAKSKISEIEGIESIDKYVVHNKEYFGCIPVRIVRHRNPLTFLEIPIKYSITFVDHVGEANTFRHKTLPEIMQSLRDLGYVFSDGADMALAAMVQAFRMTKLLEDNEDIEFTGFLPVKDNKVKVSNIEIKQPTVEKLRDALNFLVELKPHYDTRLDLLATSINWVMVAPVIFMLKTNNYFLKALHFYGFPNATKSNTGKIILAVDGHELDSRHALNFSSIDTIARLGDAVSRSTFPILVDEVNFNDEYNSRLISDIKSIIEGRTARKKFINSKASTAIDIPSLSCLVMTSNSPPPTDAGYRRRVIIRNFPQSETHKENDPEAIEFREFLRINLPRLKALGDFRNSYIMDHQNEILDEKRPDPLDLGHKILSAAFEAAGLEIPDWFNERLPENQLEESLQDNDVIVKRAFEKYVDEQFNRGLQILKSQLKEGEQVHIPDDISDRVRILAERNLLPDIKYIAIDRKFVIRRGILAELQNYGVTKEQLPNLKALADYMNAKFGKSHGNKVVCITLTELTTYLDTKEDPDQDSGDTGDSGDT